MSGMRQADYFDPKRRPAPVSDEHVAALRAFCEGGLDVKQASFAASVMHLGGVFTSEQAAAWLDANKPGWDGGDGDRALRRKQARNRFLQSLFREYGSKKRPSRLASTHQLPGGGQFAHLGSRRAYEAVGLGGSRYRRLPPVQTALQRLLLHDYVLQTMELSGVAGRGGRAEGGRWTWYGAMDQKLALFDALGVARDVLPSRDYRGEGAGGGATRRWFVDHLPVGVASWKLCFPFVFREERTVDAAVSRLEPYGPLWAALRRMGLWVQVVIVGQYGDRGDWERRVRRYVAAPSRDDRERLANRVERYLIERLCAEADGVAVLRAYGGEPGACRRLRDLERSLPRLAVGSEAMAVEVWNSKRMSEQAWSSGAAPGAGGA